MRRALVVLVCIRRAESTQSGNADHSAQSAVGLQRIARAESCGTSLLIHPIPARGSGVNDEKFCVGHGACIG
ncbi:hypothetical protein M434DRAFT_393820 [Hypoxylon sp. CO27-5]|nr:hypothetical protein M434DRAFT_393820 [Hypoxylon sp. CO27-5]